MSNDDQPLVVMEWDGGRFHGMQVAATVTSMAATIAAEDFMRRAASGKPLRGKHVLAVAGVFVSHVDRWNITRDGRPVRRTVKDFMRCDRNRVMAVLQQWVAHVAPAAAVAESEPEPVVEPAEPDYAALLEARSLQNPGPGEVLVEQVPELVGSDA